MHWVLYSYKFADLSINSSFSGNSYYLHTDSSLLKGPGCSFLVEGTVLQIMIGNKETMYNILDDMQCTTETLYSWFVRNIIVRTVQYYRVIVMLQCGRQLDVDSLPLLVITACIGNKYS